MMTHMPSLQQYSLENVLGTELGMFDYSMKALPDQTSSPLSLKTTLAVTKHSAYTGSTL